MRLWLVGHSGGLEYLLIRFSHKKRVMNVQVAGGQAATTFRKDNFV